jgi:dipeptidyl aminopeptidase/acylaminoacyl peptidase
MKLAQRVVFLTLLNCCSFLALGQELKIDDYNNAVSFLYENYNNKTAFNLTTKVNWFEDESGLWFVDYSKEGETYKTIDFNDFKVDKLFNQDKLAIELNKFLKEKVKPNSLNLNAIDKISDGNLMLTVNNTQFIYTIKKNKLEPVESTEKNRIETKEIKSPDGKWAAFSKNYNLFIKSNENGEEFQLSFDGEKNYEYASFYGWYDILEGENGERPKNFNVQWSPDSKWLAANIVDLRFAEKMYLLDWSIDSLFKPKLLSYYRGSPGDTTMVHLKPVFFNIETKQEVKTNLPKNTHINSVSLKFTEKSGVLFANYANRGFQKEYVKLIDLNNNSSKNLITEISDTNIDNFRFWYLEELQRIVFLSERTGWRQLYSLDVKTEEIKPLTNGNFYINNISFINQKEGFIYFLASGKEKNNNPYHQMLYKTDFEGNITLLTPENVHHIVNFSKNGKYFADNYSTVEIPTKTVLRESQTGKIISELTVANVDEFKQKGWKAPEVFSLIAKDGKTTIYGALWKPVNFDESKLYPIIDHSYTGPHTQVFPKSFDRSFTNQSLAELGFIVVMIDGLGTAGRSKEFHNHSYKNMKNNLEDHVLAITHLSKKYKWIDINRVGIFGHSAGGYDTGRALLGFPEFYKVGVASSADHDFRMEKAWWPEMYQGWPIDSTYHDASNITNAKNLKGKLLLVHGGIDDNVNPSATFKLAEALINADKEFDLLIMPSQRHGYTGQHQRYFTKKKWNYFVEHLAEKNPIWKFNWN